MPQQIRQPDLKHLVLLGGGHAQIAVLKSFAMNPIEGLRITLISRDVMTPYSGMLPGYLEGHYRADEITIDLSHMARLAGARFIHGEADGIDPDKKMIRIKGRPELSYDVLSVNIGSNPDLEAIIGAAKFAIPVKPISTLLDRIGSVIEPNNDHANQILTIIGGGAAGVEVTLSLDHLLTSQSRQTTIRLIHRGERIMPEFPERAAMILMKELTTKGLDVMTGVGAREITKDGIFLEDGQFIKSDQTLIVTQGHAPSFLKESGISLDDRGFIGVSPSLQSESHDDIFASGDIATVMDSPRPKAGVFAVRAGAILTKNIRAVLLGKTPSSWIPQKNYLALVGTGGGKAMAIRGQIVLSPSSWAWSLKTWIDKKFIRKFTDLPEMMPPPPAPLAQMVQDADDPAVMAMRCLGCGAKTGWSDLSKAISKAEAFISETIETSFTEIDVTADAAVMTLAKLAEMERQSSDNAKPDDVDDSDANTDTEEEEWIDGPIPLQDDYRAEDYGDDEIKAYNAYEEDLNRWAGREKPLGPPKKKTSTSAKGDTKTEMVQSVDAISALVDDPYQLGRIAALHAMSDLYASHAKPHHALALLTLPAAMADLQKDDITQILAGAMVAFYENGAYLAGGHTAQSDGDAMQVGFAVTGFREKADIYQPKDGDALIMTKPIGVGMVMAGHKQGHPLATGQLRDAAIDVMSQSNGIAADVLDHYGRFPMTDVTGFGLIRHLSSLVSGINEGDHSAELVASVLPFIQTDDYSVVDLAERGVESSITYKNKAAAPFIHDSAHDGEPRLPEALFYDPQTGGGLLVIVPREQSVEILDALIDQGVSAAHIGTFKVDGNAQIKVRATW